MYSGGPPRVSFDIPDSPPDNDGIDSSNEDDTTFDRSMYLSPSRSIWIKTLYKILPFLQWMPKYSWKDNFVSDCIAGATHASLLIPQSMAYVSLAGLPPIYGLYASMVPVLVYGLFGNCPKLSIGPFGLISLMIGQAIREVLPEDVLPGSELWIQSSTIISFWIGILLSLFGILKLGNLQSFLMSEGLIAGFTTACGLSVAVSQLNAFVGMSEESDSLQESHIFSIFIELINFFKKAPFNFNIASFSFGIFCIAFLYIVPRIATNLLHIQRVPDMFLLIILSIIISAAFPSLRNDHGLAVVGKLPSGLPTFKPPPIFSSQYTIPLLYKSLNLSLLCFALTLSVIATYSESSLASIQKNQYGRRRNSEESPEDNHETTLISLTTKGRPNQELIALGMSNLLGSLFESYPVCGSLSRSSLLDESGAVSNFAGLFSLAFTFITLLFLTPIFSVLPLSVLAAIILAAIRSIVQQIFAWRNLWKSHRPHAIEWMLCFFSVLIFNVQNGLVLSLIFALLFRGFNRFIFPKVYEIGVADEQLGTQDAVANVKFGRILYVPKALQRFSIFKSSKKIPGVTFFKVRKHFSLSSVLPSIQKRIIRAATLSKIMHIKYIVLDLPEDLTHGENSGQLQLKYELGRLGSLLESEGVKMFVVISDIILESNSLLLSNDNPFKVFYSLNDAYNALLNGEQPLS